MTPAPLSTRLRDETTEAHHAAERGPWIRDLLRGAVDRGSYAAFLAALSRLYTALEAALERHADLPTLAPLHWPALWRSDALARDLAALLGPAWRDHVDRDTAADGHVARITAIAAADPTLLVGHAYTRYLGDLSGGQLLRGAVARFAPDAVALYAFPDLDIASAKREFRARLDALPLAPHAATAVVDEARRAFALHGQLVAALPGPARAAATA